MATKAIAKRRRTFSKKRGYSPRKMTLPLAVLMGFVPLVGLGISTVKTQGWQGLSGLSSALIPFDTGTGRWTTANLKYGAFPIIAGLLTHKLAGMLGVNRALAAARVPFLRV